MDNKQGGPSDRVTGEDDCPPFLTKSSSSSSSNLNLLKNLPAGLNVQNESALQDYIVSTLSFDSVSDVPNPIFNGVSTKHEYYERQERDGLREAFILTATLKEHIIRKTAAVLSSCPAPLLNTKLRKLIRQTDNPPNFQILMQRLAAPGNKEPVESDESEDEVEPVDGRINIDTDSEPVLPRLSPTQLAPVRVSASDTATIPLPLPTTPKNSTTLSEDVFQTPGSRLEGMGESGYIAPVSSGASTPTPRTRQFGDNRNKQPRLKNPGEVVYSATGSPIASANVLGALPPRNGFHSPPTVGSTTMDFQGTFVTRLRQKPVVRTSRVKIDSCSGPSFDVDLICSTRGPLEQKLFRKFLKEFKAFATTRLVLQKSMKPRCLNTTRGIGQQRGNVTVTCASKPWWRT